MISGDEPIERPEDDVLGRVRVAEVIAGEIRRIDVSRGAVVGVLGPWGSGKTSLINLVRKELDQSPSITVLDFNPWMFSGADQLVENFFIELAAQLRLAPGKLRGIADELASYGERVAPLQVFPIVGPWVALFSGATKALKNLNEKRKGGVAETRKALWAKLRELETPIVVVIDDVDRLHTDEIRDIFKLIRLTASFPNVLYLVAFDRTRVERALEEDQLPGRDYLEKIVQVTYDIPAVPGGMLEQQITAAMNESLADIADPGPFDESRWPDIFVEVILPLFRTMRDVRRYAASLPGTVQSLEGRIALEDVLSLEAIRVFLPDLFAAVAQSREALTTPWSDADRETDPRLAASINALLAAAKERRGVATAMITRIFPAAIHHIENSRYGPESLPMWLRGGRVAHPHLLGFYLERVAGTELQAFWKAKRAVEVLADRGALETYMRSLNWAEWEDVIRYLEPFEGEFPVEAAEPATIVLLNLMPEIPERPRGVFDRDSKTKVERVVLRLLRRLPTTEAVEMAVQSALPEISTLSGKRTLLNLVGHEENAGNKLISLAVSLELESALRDEIRTAAPEALAAEPELFRLLSWTKRTAEASEPSLELPTDTVLDCALLKDAVSEERTQTMGTRAVRTERVLIWNPFVDLVGGEASVRRIVDACRDRDDSSLTEAIELADRYLNGWRPRNP